MEVTEDQARALTPGAQGEPEAAAPLLPEVPPQPADDAPPAEFTAAAQDAAARAALLRDQAAEAAGQAQQVREDAQARAAAILAEGRSLAAAMDSAARRAGREAEEQETRCRGLGVAARHLQQADDEDRAAAEAEAEAAPLRVAGEDHARKLAAIRAEREALVADRATARPRAPMSAETIEMTARLAAMDSTIAEIQQRHSAVMDRAGALDRAAGTARSRASGHRGAVSRLLNDLFPDRPAAGRARNAARLRALDDTSASRAAAERASARHGDILLDGRVVGVR